MNKYLPSDRIGGVMMKLADPTFGLDSFAWPLLAILATFEPSFAKFNDSAMMYEVRLQTDIYRSGGKNWGAITMAPAMDGSGPKKVLAFGRDPYKDEIIVESWRMSDEVTEETVSTLHRFQADELMKAAAFIRDELASAYRLARPQA